MSILFQVANMLLLFMFLVSGLVLVNYNNSALMQTLLQITSFFKHGSSLSQSSGTL